jgi:hypothetical protein
MLCNQCDETDNGPKDLGVLSTLAAPVNIVTDHLNYCEFFLSSPHGTYGCNKPAGVLCFTTCLQCAKGSSWTWSGPKCN